MRRKFIAAVTSGVLALTVRPDAVTTTRINLSVASTSPGSHRIRFRLRDPATGEIAVRDAIFMSGAQR